MRPVCLNLHPLMMVRPHKVAGTLHSIMAGLACGEPIPIGWEIIRDFVYCYCTCPDYVTARGMRILAKPHRRG